MDKYYDLGALDFSKKIADGEFTILEVFEIFKRRIEKLNPTINAVNITYYDDGNIPIPPYPHNLEEYPLYGYPILIKDLIDVGGRLSTFGSFSCKNNIPNKSVDYINEIEKAGMIISGRTNVPEFASTANTWNQLFGATLNPWNISKSVLASSGGSAAAIASGITPLAHGTDGGGSNRLPASVCGIFGFKPSRKRTVSGEPDGNDTSGKSFLKCNGPMSRKVIDSAALFDICEDKSADSLYPAIGMVTKPDTYRKLKIGYLRNGVAGVKVDDEMIDIQDSVKAKLENLGHEIVPFEALDITSEFLDEFVCYFLSRFTLLVESTDNPKENLSPFINSESSYINNNYTSDDIENAKYLIENVYPGLIIQELFDKNQFDVVFSAVHPTTTPSADFFGPLDIMDDTSVKKLGETLALTLMANVAGYPSMSVPLTFPFSLILQSKSYPSIDNGLETPIGSLFNAKPGDEKTLFELAYQLEEHYPWADQWPANSTKNIFDLENKFSEK